MCLKRHSDTQRVYSLPAPIFNYQKALSLNNKYVKAHFNLANVLKKVGRYDEAIISFEKAIDLKIVMISPKSLGQ